MVTVADLPVVRRAHAMPWSACALEEGGVQFRMFAPDVASVSLRVQGEPALHRMSRTGDGWHEYTHRSAAHGTRYQYVLPDGTAVPDPTSRYQQVDVEGPSEVVDPRGYEWHDAGWRGRAWEEAVLYELHVGTFTPEGTFLAAIGRLDHLVNVGVTAIELMALAQCPGSRNWGYDMVLMYAPSAAYGRPEDLKALIDAAHARGLMVILDVVYNHFGPRGNMLAKYFARMCSDRHENEWGKSLNFDGPGSEQVRKFVVDSALYWIEEFHADGLRLDATHAMVDDSPRHILDEIADEVHARAGDRMVHLILEDERNVSDRLGRDPHGAANHISGQWNHSTALLRELPNKSMCDGAQDDAKRTEAIARMLAEGYRGRNGDEDGCSVPPTAYVSFFQTHDLVGNALHGERIYGEIPLRAARALSAVYLLIPQIPMLFMGDEWGASTPFTFFCDMDGELAEGVRKGRQAFLAKNLKISLEEAKGTPDPVAMETFQSAKLNWDERHTGVHAEWMQWYQSVLGVRRECLTPLLRGLRERCGQARVLAPGAFTVNWKLNGGTLYRLDANLCGHEARGFGTALPHAVWQEGTFGSGGQAAAWSVRFSRSTLHPLG